ncbi:APC family permease [Actinocatenispora rupis]|uniref:Amino acid permease n=1 Tax=Actinocatenispora rupis TaxID=519421 RepID=A0A8J3J0N1_9ACTN|nr:amino acid permease [Actinocatenispora rupis]GID09346.1 amino acid permease [Actinocatenispora rupis]
MAKLGTPAGVAMYVGAVLGPGVLALPALAVRTAGPASILSWAGLLAVSGPIAAAFAALGARYPDGGGVASFVRRALGPRAAAAVGWWFYLVVPVGTVAGAVVGAQYVGLGGYPGTVATAALLLAAAFAANALGLRLSGALQTALVAVLVALLVVAVTVAAPDARAANLTPFAPHGAGSVLSAAGVLFFGFAGWEAGTHLSAEFRDPRRTLPRVTALALVAVTVLYLGLALVTVTVLGPAAGRTPVPLTVLLAHGIGPAARPVTAVAAVLLAFGAINTYLASAARLGAALARDGALPHALAGTPRRSLTLLAVLTAAVLGADAYLRLPLDTLLRATAACLAAVVTAGMLAAALLLPRRTPTWYGALVGGAATLAVLAATGPLLAYPVVVGVAGAAFHHAHRAKRARRTHPDRRTSTAGPVR